MASVSNNFEINVAKKRKPDDKYGVHFCKIQLPCNFEIEAVILLDFFRKLFGEEYHVSMTYWECYGKVKEDWK